MTIRPAAGPLIVISELVIKKTRIPPTIAVMTPIIGRKLLAPAILKLSGKAMRATRKPDNRSSFQFSVKPLKPAAGFFVAEFIIFIWIKK
jgi:hypothetical protein